MVIQHQIKRQLGGRIEEIRTLITERPEASRTAIAEELCERYGFLDARSRPQTSSCRKALRDLSEAGSIELPASRRAHPPSRDR